VVLSLEASNDHHMTHSSLCAVALMLPSCGLAMAQIGEPAPVPPKPPAPPAIIVSPAPEKPSTTDDAPPFPQLHAVEVLRQEAAAVLPMLTGEEAVKFVLSVGWLPVVDDRVIWVNREKREAKSEMEMAETPEAERAGFEQRTIPSSYFYNTRFGSPLAYVRAIELGARHIGDLPLIKGRRILDFGYGNATHLRMMASLGSDVTGVDVDPILRALYSNPDDTGTIPGALLDPPAPAGKLTLVHGAWPGNPEDPAGVKVREQVGGNFDLIISKNTLKNGYINPEKPVDPKMLVQLGVSNEAFVEALAGALRPGGLLIIYNLSPKQREDSYIPWADGRCPFPREMLEAKGFEVIEFDRNDDDFARRMGQALGWDRGDQPMDLQNDLFALYTILRRK
jgi:SAM-dependent methyltransferase